MYQGLSGEGDELLLGFAEVGMCVSSSVWAKSSIRGERHGCAKGWAVGMWPLWTEITFAETWKCKRCPRYAVMEVCSPCETDTNLFFKLFLHYFFLMFIFLCYKVECLLKKYCQCISRNSCVCKFPSACSCTFVLEVDILLLEIQCKCE